MIEELLKKLELSNSKLLKISFTHSSFLNENFSNAELESNERLEFLGDSVISYIVAEYNPKGRPGVFRKSLAVVSNSETNSQKLSTSTYIYIKGKVSKN